MKQEYYRLDRYTLTYNLLNEHSKEISKIWNN